MTVRRRRPGHRRASWLALLLGVSLAAITSGCATLGAGAGAVVEPVIAEPWQLAAEDFPSQRLYRVHYEGPEGKLSFKLVLQLLGRSHFRMQAADGLGRKLWVLRLEPDGRALWINHREGSYCRTDGDAGLAWIPLTRLPLEGLPRLLLGRLPATPAGDLRQLEDRLSYLDRQGQTWVGTLRGGLVDRWTLLGAGEPAAWWQRDDDSKPGAIFSDRRGQQQVRWRQVVHEHLAQAPEADPVPEDYRLQNDC